jgi:hypothetical protein
MSTCNCWGLETLGSRPIMPKNLPGGFELSPRGDAMHSIERGIIPLIVSKWRINQTSLCNGSCLRMINSSVKVVGVLIGCLMVLRVPFYACFASILGEDRCIRTWYWV